jgi:hypothetical protein
MESLRAKIVDAQVWWSLVAVVRKPDDDEVVNQGKPLVEMDTAPMETHINERLQSWLDTCEGRWEIITHIDRGAEVEFERDEDYVRYCFDWL